MVPIAYAQAATNAAGNAAQQGSNEFVEVLLNKLPFILVAIFIFLSSFFVGKIARRLAQRAILRTGKYEGAFAFVGKTVYIACVVIGSTIALKITGVDISFIVGAVGFGLGFGMKNLLENYIAGIIIVVQEPFRIGDMVQVNEYFGRIEQIEARATMMRLFDGQRAIIPNAEMTANPITNFSTFPERRINIEVGVAYDSNMSQVIDVCLKALQSDRRILRDPSPLVTFSSFADSNMMVNVRFWIDHTVSNWLQMTSVGCQLVKDAFDKNGIKISFPIRTLSMNPLDSDDLYQLLPKAKALQKQETPASSAEPSRN